MYNLYIGQKLRCLNGEYVTINEISDDAIIVKYKGKLYSRPKAIIGQKLIVIDHDRQATGGKQLRQEKTATVQNEEIKYSCTDCRINRRGDCFGQREICKDFKPRPRISKEEIESWPKVMMGPYYR